MTHVDEMIHAHPAPPEADLAALSRCVQACAECVQTCTACADACLSEPQILKLVRCVRLNLDCADLCGATMRVLSRQTQPDSRILTSVLETCLAACRVCRDECDRHAGEHEHCQACAGSCLRCEQACAELLRSGA